MVIKSKKKKKRNRSQYDKMKSKINKIERRIRYKIYKDKKLTM